MQLGSERYEAPIGALAYVVPQPPASGSGQAYGVIGLRNTADGTLIFLC